MRSLFRNRQRASDPRRPVPRPSIELLEDRCLLDSSFIQTALVSDIPGLAPNTNPNLILLFRGLWRDPRVPRGSKLLLGFGLVWLASPIDLIPEFVPVVGPLDDAIVAALILRSVARRVGKSVLAEHWRGDPRRLRERSQ